MLIHAGGETALSSFRGKWRKRERFALFGCGVLRRHLTIGSISMHIVQVNFLCAMLNEGKSTRNQPVIQNIESEMTTADINVILLYPLALSRALLSDRWGRHFDRKKKWPIAFSCKVSWHSPNFENQSVSMPTRERGGGSRLKFSWIFLAAVRAGHFYFYFSFTLQVPFSFHFLMFCSLFPPFSHLPFLSLCLDPGEGWTDPVKDPTRFGQHT